MKIFLRYIVAFFAITGLVIFLNNGLGLQFGRSDYWSQHGVVFLICISFFPRLTLLFSNVLSGGFLWWLGWLVSPRLLVAFLATQAYWYQNPILVITSWLIAFGGESSEKYVFINRSRARWGNTKGFETAKWVESDK